MKKSKFVALALLATGVLGTACSSNGIKTATLKTQADSISYAIGVSQFPSEVREGIMQQYDNDSTVLGQVVKGIEYGYNHQKLNERAYAMGVSMAQGIVTEMPKQLNASIIGEPEANVFNVNNVLSAFITLANGKETVLTAEEAQKYLSDNIESLKDDYSNGLIKEVTVDPKTEVKLVLENKADTVAYAIAISQFPANLREVLAQQFENNEAMVDEMLKGVEFGRKNLSKDDRAYAMGITMAQSIATNMMKQLNANIMQDEASDAIKAENVLNVLVTVLEGKATKMTPEEAQSYLQEAIPAIQAKQNEAKYSEAKAKNAAFLAENAKKEGVVTTESGLQYKVLTEGTGKTWQEGQEVNLHYEGKLIDGTIFDSSYERGESITFSPEQVVKGFGEALKMMPVGSTWEVYIPQELGYGSRDQGKIKPYSTLIFKIEVLDLVTVAE